MTDVSCCTVEGLTRTQRAALTALNAMTADGWPARVRDIQRGALLSSPSQAQRALLQLAELGLAAQHPRNPRGGWLPTAAGRSA